MIKRLAFTALVLFGIFVLFKIPFGIEYQVTWFFVGFALLVAGRDAILNDADDLQMNWSFGLGAMILIGVTVISFLTSPMFLSEKYVNLVEVQDANLSDFNTEEENTRRVTLPMALQVANKVLGTKHEGTQLSSQYEIDDSAASVQEVNKELVWVLPLDYSGFWKWVNLEYVPGYIKLSATDPKAKPELVLDKKITISKNGYWGDSIRRQVWFKSGLKETNTHLEIDDEGNPYYISAVIQPEIVMSADGVSKVIVTDAQTKKMEILPVEEVTKKYPWVDRVWPEYIIRERIDSYGSLQDGWINSKFIGKNVSVPTQRELWLVKANNTLNWFTGMTSTNSLDQSLVSGIFVESASVSKKPILHVFNMSMVSDENGAIAAMDSALGADGVKWDVVLPQPYIVDNKFYWTGVVVSGTNIFQKKAYMQGDDISNVSFNRAIMENPKVGESENPEDHLNAQEGILKQIFEKLEEINILKTKYKEAGGELPL